MCPKTGEQAGTVTRPGSLPHHSTPSLQRLGQSPAHSPLAMALPIGAVLLEWGRPPISGKSEVEMTKLTHKNEDKLLEV